MPSVHDVLSQLQSNNARPATCSDSLADPPWFQSGVGYGPGASERDIPPTPPPSQPLLPVDYQQATQDELEQRIAYAKSQLGDRLTILGHFYQRDEIVRHADFIGDSFQLAQQSQSRPLADFIVFCGVHFMAETAAILSEPHQRVILPNLAAGCSMADMADTTSVNACWQQLHEQSMHNIDVVPTTPVTYMNSSAALKAFCGRNNGVVCTSSNARAVLEWAFTQSERVLFFPDQHLGRNTALAMSIPTDQLVVWDPAQPLGGNAPEALQSARVILWKGHCSVHMRFTVDQITRARASHPGVRVLVHPECTHDVVAAADESGSTNEIQRIVKSAPPGQTFAIGTEINMVNRLAHEHPEHHIFCLDSLICPCSTMYRIHPAYLAWVLESALAGEVVNEIAVADSIARDARIALQRMLDIAS